MKNFSLLLAIIGIGLNANAQFEQKYWYFGPNNYGINYNYSTGNYSILNNMNSNFSAEGNTTVNDPLTGNLIFYTDGIRVYDNNHTLMPNGNGLNGNLSAAQNGLVCPDPGQCGRYYVFSNSSSFDAIPSGILTGSMYYSLIDMSLPGNGSLPSPKGDVVSGSKNIFLTNGITEAALLVKRSNSKDYWLVLSKPQQNYIVIYRITSSGIAFHNSFPLNITLTRAICLRTNPSRNKIVLSSHIGNETVVQMDFDPSTGTILSAASIPGTPFNSTFSPWCAVYDMIFSQDGSKLYLSKYRYANPAGPGGQLYQYDFNNPSQSPVLITQVSNNYTHYARGLQRGPDGKVLFLYTNSSGNANIIGAVVNPNLPGISCTYQSNFLAFPSNPGNIGMFPNFLEPNHAPISNPDTIQLYSSCLNDSVYTFDLSLLNSDQDNDGITYSNFASTNGFQLQINSTQLQVTIPANFSGSETISYVICDDHCFSLCDTGFVFLQINNSNNVPYVNLGNDVILCSNSSITLSSSLNPSSANYLWSDGSINPTLNVNSPGTYWLEISTSCGVDRDSVVITANNLLPIQLPGDTGLCPGSTFNYTLNVSGFSNLQWSTGSTSTSFTITNSGNYWLMATDANGCISHDTIQVINYPLPNVNLGQDTIICNSNPITLNAQNSGATYLWNTNETTQSIVVNSPGLYIVTVNNGFCNSKDSIQISYSSAPQINLGNDTLICNNDSLEIVPFGSTGNGTLLWNNGSSDSSLFVTNSGIYWIEISNACGVDRDSIVISMVNPTPIQLPSDTSFCSGSNFSLLLDASGFSNVQWSDGSSSNTLLVTTSGTYSVVVSDANSCLAYDTIQIASNASPSVNLGPDIINCGNYLLGISNPNWVITWNGSVQSDSIIVTNTGLQTVTVVDQNGCSGQDSIFITLTQIQPIDLGNDTVICSNLPFVLNYNIIGYDSLVWSNGSTATNFSINASGTYFVTAYQDLCLTNDTIVVSNHPSPSFNFGPDYEGCPLELSMIISNVNYQWSTGETGSNIYIDSSGLYSLIVTNSFGCSASDSIYINIISNGGYFSFIPNVFSPNNDGVNDVFKIEGSPNLCVDKLIVSIYNRWGQLLFTSEDLDFEWDGTDTSNEKVPDGLYFVIFNGIYGGIDISRHHAVTLLR